MADTIYAGVAWDIDGTLIDSEQLHFDALRVVCNRYGRPISSAENIEALGLSLDQMWIFMKLGEALPISEAIWQEMIFAYYRENLSPSMARREAVAAVRSLHSRNVPQVFVTTAERSIAEANIGAIGLVALGIPIVAREDVENTKPNPDPYLKAAEILGYEAHRLLAIEDTVVGSEAASSAGLYTVVWPNDMTKRLDFPAANLVVSNLDEIPGLSAMNALN